MTERLRLADMIGKKITDIRQDGHELIIILEDDTGLTCYLDNTFGFTVDGTDERHGMRFQEAVG